MRRPDLPRTFYAFEDALKEEYEQFTPEYAEIETGVPAHKIVEAAEAIASAGTAFSTHSRARGRGGTFVGLARSRDVAYALLVVLTGAIGEPGGV